MPSRIQILAAVLLQFVVGLAQLQAQGTTNFLAATDFSDLAYFESLGVTYKDNGQVEDGLRILKNHGLECVRLRLWTSSQAQALSDPYNYINNTNYTIPLAVRVKNAGLLFSLDFHYSDTWADPGHQATPSAWTNLNFTQLVQQMYAYNSNTIYAFATAGAMPDYVQVGNEITSGLLFPNGGPLTGSSNTIWSQCGQLLKAAVQGIRDASSRLGTPAPKIIVHIDRGGDWSTTEWFFDNLQNQGVPFDIIGESYYPFFQGNPSNLDLCLDNAAVRYGKPMIVAEDAFPYTNACPSSWLSELYGYPPTPAGQVSFMALLAGILERVPDKLGAGFFYWGAEYQAANGVPEAGYNTSSFFDPNGNLLPVADAIGGMAAPLMLKGSLQGTNLLLQWPLSGAAATLMISTNVGASASWLAVTNSPQLQATSGVFTVTLPTTTTPAFYRLQ